MRKDETSLVPRLSCVGREKRAWYTVCAFSVPPGFLGIRKLADIMPYTIPSIIVSLFVVLQLKMVQGFDEVVTYALRAVGKECIVLKTEQLEAIRHIYDGKDVFLWLPTGFGKSICYETLLFVFDYKLQRVSGTTSSSVVLVISPWCP